MNSSGLSLEAWLETPEKESFPIERHCLIGRREASSIYIGDKKVSRSHALIQNHGNTSVYWLMDLGSRNGSSLNHKRIREPMRLRDGDLISVANYRFTFRQALKEKPEASLSSLESTSILDVQAPPASVTAAQHGVILLGKDVQIESITPAAQAWLTEYFGATFGNRLPRNVEIWLSNQSSLTRNHSRPPVLTATLENQRLLIRLEESSPRQQLLLLTKETPVFSEEMLKSLGLTPRESEVLIWVSQGKSNPEIATILGVSPRTIEKHLEHVFEKLGVESRTAAIFCAVDALGS